jgi:hypothetical protein
MFYRIYFLSSAIYFFSLYFPLAFYFVFVLLLFAHYYFLFFRFSEFTIIFIRLMIDLINK